MLEPLAASVISTIFAARPLAANNTSAQSAFKIMCHGSSSAFPQTFFNPRPRPTPKGKERAGSEVHCGVCEQDGASSGCVGNLATTSASVHKTSRTSGPARSSRIRRPPDTRPLSKGSTSRISDIRCWPSRRDPLQRRHASSLPERKQSEPYKAAELNPHLQQLLHVIKHPGTHDMADAWRAYEFSRLRGFLSSLSIPDMLAFADKVVDYAEAQDSSNLNVHWMQWGVRLQAILQDIEPRLAESSTFPSSKQVWRSLVARALALLGRHDDAAAESRQVVTEGLGEMSQYHYLRMHQTLILTLWKRRGAVAALEFIVDQWDIFEAYLTFGTRRNSSLLAYTPCEQAFRSLVSDVAVDLRDPDDFFDAVDFRRLDGWLYTAGTFLIRVLCYRKFVLEAVVVHTAMRTRELEPSARDSLLLVKSLTQSRAFVQATALFNSLREMKDTPWKPSYLRTALYLYAHQGDIPRTKRWFNEVAAHCGSIMLGDITLLMHVYADQGDVEGTLAVYNEYFTNSHRKPNLRHFTALLLAHARANDSAGMNEWFMNMVHAGIVPDAHVYSIVLQSFAERGDVRAVSDILTRMRNAGHPPSRHSYTSVIALLARKKHPAAAEELFQRALDEGVVPDRQMVTAVMNAHVEAGNWRGVIAAFDRLTVTGRGRGIPITIEVYNTLLKAYVLMGAPWTVVSTLCANMVGTRIQPDAHTYSLLIQSACDNGQMSEATQLYDEMQSQASLGQSHLRMNVYVLTILMAGWLRKLEPAKAKEIYELMLEQDIQPNSITFHHIIKAYSNQRSERSVQVALKFLGKLIAMPGDRAWLSSARDLRDGLDRLYGPLLTAYARAKDPKRVEELLQELIDQGGEPSIGTLTALLDVYRRQNNLRRVKKVWREIYDLALQRDQVNDLFEDKDAENPIRRGNLLCIPLSIYIDALSLAGEHLSVARVWRIMRDDGFAFDCNNWNQLAIALIRAGQPARAFDILERVLFPYQRAAASMFRERPTPNSPVTAGFPSLDDLPKDYVDAHARDRPRRLATIRLQRRRLKHLVLQLRQAPNDFTRPLHILHLISPSWSDWGPHPVLLELLGAVLVDLQTSAVVKMVPRGGGSLVPRKPLVTDRKLYNERGYGRLQMRYIREKCPFALKRVRMWLRRTQKHMPSLVPRIPGRQRFTTAERMAMRHIGFSIRMALLHPAFRRRRALHTALRKGWKEKDGAGKIERKTKGKAKVQTAISRKATKATAHPTRKWIILRAAVLKAFRKFRRSIKARKRRRKAIGNSGSPSEPREQQRSRRQG